MIAGVAVFCATAISAAAPAFAFGYGAPGQDSRGAITWDISGFYFHDAAVQTNGVDDPTRQRNDPRIRLANNIRYFPSRVPGLRLPGLNNLWDISIVKQIRATERVRAQLHVEFLNAFNRVVYGNPTTDPTAAEFGKVNSQNNLPRDIQLAMKIVF